MNCQRITIRLTLLILILFAFPLFAATLSYDQASGILVGFDLAVADTQTNSNDYNNTNSYWVEPYQYIGRLAYSGGPATLSFFNSGSSAVDSQNLFYFTYMTNGISHLDRWRAFFLVAKIRVIRHGSTQHEDYGDGKNKRILSPGNSFTVPGSGPSDDQVNVGQWGYNADGEGNILGTKKKDRDYIYRYQYKSVWIDLTVIRRTQIHPSPLPLGFYETKFLVEANTGPTCNFHLVGENNPEGPSDFLFTILNVAPSPFPFEDIRNKNSVQDSLKLAEVSYFSSLDAATLEFSSSSNGSAANFQLTSGGFSIPYKVVFDCSIPAQNPVTIHANTRFYSQYTSTPSPIDTNVTNANVISGDLSIYLEQPMNPMAGTYTSKIYCILTQAD